jgi:hypothetical protein
MRRGIPTYPLQETLPNKIVSRTPGDRGHLILTIQKDERSDWKPLPTIPMQDKDTSKSSNPEKTE